MLSFKSRAPSVDVRLFREAMGQPTVARELFLPLDRAWWDGGRFTLGRWGARARRPALSGVRLQEPRTGKEGIASERDTQGDLCALVGSVAELRRVPELSSLVLSGETLIGRQKGTVPGKRVLFGLSCAPGSRFQAEADAAAECQRVLRKAVKRAGFVVDHPRHPFDPNSGFEGLRKWSAALRLRRNRARRAWLIFLLFLPLLLLPLIARVPIPGTPSIAALTGSTDTPPASAAVSPAPTATPTPPIAGKPFTPGPGPAVPGATPAKPGPSPEDPMASVKSIEDALKQLKELGGDSGKLPSSLSELTGGGGTTNYASQMITGGTIAYFVGGAWLLWAAPEAGVGAVLGLLLLPGYAIVLARGSWSRTWLPFVLHMGGLVLVIVGCYYFFMSMFRALGPLLG
jgi:hypothetical protein